MTLFLIVLVAAFNLIWHIRFYGKKTITRKNEREDTNGKVNIFVSSWNIS